MLLDSSVGENLAPIRIITSHVANGAPRLAEEVEEDLAVITTVCLSRVELTSDLGTATGANIQ